MLPEARIKHRIAGRLRFQIESRKGDAPYFDDVETRLRQMLAYRTVTASPLTGSLVIEDDALDEATVYAAARDHGLFSISTAELTPKPFVKRIVDPVRIANRSIHVMSGGVVDLPAIIFLLLLASGLWELAIGNFKRPPWYTALWYAFGLFSKTLFDELNKEKH
jgi:hypothetical protein